MTRLIQVKLMMTLRELALILLTGSTLLSPCRAQPLDRLLEMADSLNPTFRALDLEKLAILEQIPQVGQLPEPEAGIGMFVLPVETRLGPQWVRLSVSQMFPWPGTLSARKAVVQSLASTQDEKIATARQDIHYEIKRAWIQLVELTSKQAILQKQLDLIRIHEAVTTSSVEAGRSGITDILQTQIRIRDIEVEIRLLETRKVKPEAIINQFLNQPSGTRINVPDTLSPVGSDTLVPQWAIVLQNNPSVRILSAQQETARRRIDLNEQEGLPNLTAGVDYIAVGRRSDAEPSGNGRDILSPRIGIRIPLFQEKYRAKAREEQLHVAALESQKTSECLRIRSVIEKAIADLEEGRMSVDLYNEQRETTRTAMNLMLEAYKTDQSRFRDLVDIEDRLLHYDLMQLDALVRTWMARIDLDRYLTD